jgi:cysteine desulfurase/selenocysteine lyase
VFPIEDVVTDAHKKGVPVLVDAAQTAGFWEIDVGKARIDFLAFSGHKALYGPQGTGCLYVAEGHALKSLKHGGTGSRSEEDVHPRFLPDGLEAGTPNTPGIAGLAAGTRFVAQEGHRKIQKHEIDLAHDIMHGLGHVRGVRVYGPLPGGLRCPVISFTIGGMDNGAVAMRLEREFGVMCRSGLHCAPWAHRTIGTYPHGTLRFSPGLFNTIDDVVMALEAVRAIAKG